MNSYFPRLNYSNFIETQIKSGRLPAEKAFKRTPGLNRLQTSIDLNRLLAEPVLHSDLLIKKSIDRIKIESLDSEEELKRKYEEYQQQISLIQNSATKYPHIYTAPFDVHLEEMGEARSATYPKNFEIIYVEENRPNLYLADNGFDLTEFNTDKEIEQMSPRIKSRILTPFTEFVKSKNIDLQKLQNLNSDLANFLKELKDSELSLDLIGTNNARLIMKNDTEPVVLMNSSVAKFHPYKWALDSWGYGKLLENLNYSISSSA